VSYKSSNRPRTYQIPPRSHSLPSGMKGKTQGFYTAGSGRLPRGFSKCNMATAERVFTARSERSKSLDLVKMADIAPSLEAWLRSPNRLDIPSIDSPNAALVFSHKSKKAQAIDLAKAARRVPLEVWIRNTGKGDIAGIDTKKAKLPKKPERPVRKFRIVKKEEANKLEKERGKKQEGRKLPTREEILKRATGNRLEEQVKKGLPSITPEEKELKETGEFEKARVELMRGQGSEVHSQIERYVSELNEQLEPEGFRVVPID
jgi:hypothetical protein